MITFGDFGNVINDSDSAAGLRILEQYHNEASNYSAYGFNTVNELINSYGSKGSFIAEGLGLNARVNGLDYEDTAAAMKMLADAGAGKIPQNFLAYNNALGKYAANPGWFETLTYVASESASELQAPFASVGQGVIAGLNLGRYAAPIIMWGGLALVIYFVAKNTGASVGSIGKAVENLTQRGK